MDRKGNWARQKEVECAIAAPPVPGREKMSVVACVQLPALWKTTMRMLSARARSRAVARHRLPSDWHIAAMLGSLAPRSPSAPALPEPR
jgi:hypothetical protein